MCVSGEVKPHCNHGSARELKRLGFFFFAAVTQTTGFVSAVQAVCPGPVRKTDREIEFP